jgi:hypothetical protein
MVRSYGRAQKQACCGRPRRSVPSAAGSDPSTSNPAARACSRTNRCCGPGRRSDDDRKGLGLLLLVPDGVRRPATERHPLCGEESPLSRPLDRLHCALSHHGCGRGVCLFKTCISIKVGNGLPRSKPVSVLPDSSSGIIIRSIRALCTRCGHSLPVIGRRWLDCASASGVADRSVDLLARCQHLCIPL